MSNRMAFALVAALLVASAAPDISAGADTKPKADLARGVDWQFDDESLITVTPLHSLDAKPYFPDQHYRILTLSEIREAQRELEISPAKRDAWFREAGLGSGLEQMDQLARDLLIEWAGWAQGAKLHQRFPQFTPASLDRLRSLVTAGRGNGAK